MNAMSHNSILELLSVTSNAVKALEKTCSSGSGGGTPRLDNDRDVRTPLFDNSENESQSKPSRDSGFIKTETDTRSDKGINHKDTDTIQDSDHSTTASDVLIRSTIVDQKGTRNFSVSSQSLSGMREFDNFNVADAKKVKVLKKHLREIISPRDSFNGSQAKSPVSEDDFRKPLKKPKNVSDFNNNSKKTHNSKPLVINGLEPKNIPGIPKRFLPERKHEQTSVPNTGVFKNDESKKVDSISSPSIYIAQHHENDSKKYGPIRGFPQTSSTGVFKKDESRKVDSVSSSSIYMVQHHENDSKKHEPTRDFPLGVDSVEKDRIKISKKFESDQKYPTLTTGNGDCKHVVLKESSDASDQGEWEGKTLKNSN